MKSHGTVAVCTTLLLVLTGPVGAAYASTGCATSGHGSGTGIGLIGHCNGRKGNGSSDGDGSGSESGPPTRTVECSNQQSIPPVSGCIAPPDCPDGVAWEYEQQVNRTWVPVGAPYCNHADPPPPPNRAPTVAQIRDAAYRLLPAITIGSAPHGAGLTQTETVLWADTPTHRALPDVTLLGHDVHLRISFEHADWDYGDGTSATMTNPGKPYDDTTDPCDTAQCPDYTGHTYTQTGIVTVRLTITWTAHYQLTGQGWQPIPDTITGPAATTSLHIREARGVLVQ